MCRNCKIFGGVLVSVLLVSVCVFAQSGESTTKRTKAPSSRNPKSRSAVEAQIKALQDQMNAQQSQIKQQQDQIQNLQQQLQQSNSQLQQQQSAQTQLQNAVQQSDQKASAAQQSAEAARTTLAAQDAKTTTITQTLQTDQKQIDKLVNPEKYLPQPKVVQAVAPVRVLAIDPPKKDGLIPSFRLGAVRVTPYGFIKATVAEDSSSPGGNDFPLPGFIAADTGPNQAPETHFKARSSRVGLNFEWPDLSKKLTLTGRIEGDFEGNFSRVNNRNVSSLRSNAFQLRLAYARLDYMLSDKTDIYFQGGQDWSLFGSGILPNLLETTLLGAYFGTIYERDPQMRLGLVQKLGGSRDMKIVPEIGVMMPAFGLLPGDTTTCPVPAPGATSVTCTVTNGLGNQLGYGERQGADANRPEYEGRLTFQFKADKAEGVAPAQLSVSGFESRRVAIVTHAAEVAAALPAAYLTAFPKGVENHSTAYGIQVGGSIPTRWATLTVSAYRGADLRWYFGGQLLSNFNDPTGLTATKGVPSVDGSSTVFFGTNGAGLPAIAPQRAIAAYGGFVNLGFPLSRWFHADPKGHNAGWQLYAHYGLDAVKHSDFVRAKDIGVNGGGPYRSTVAAGTLYYKFNQWCQFAFEESFWSSYALPNDAGIFTANTSVAGVPSRVWRDRREEFGPIFTF